MKNKTLIFLFIATTICVVPLHYANAANPDPKITNDPTSPYYSGYQNLDCSTPQAQQGAQCKQMYATLDCSSDAAASTPVCQHADTDYYKAQGTEFNQNNPGLASVGNAVLGAVNTAADVGGCAFTTITLNIFGTAGTCLSTIAQDVLDFILGILNALLWFLGAVLAFVIDKLVVNMGYYVTSSSAVGIQYAWQVVRDLANIAIVAALIAIAISTILQIEKYNANKLLARIIIAAILVNFSYFFAGAIIDSSNYLATQIYNNVVCGAQTTNCGGSNVVVRFEALEPTKTLEDTWNNWAGTFTNSQNGPATQLLTRVGMLIMVLIAIFVFLSAIALLLGRFVALIFLLITSPVGIAGGAIPGVQKYAGEWWEILIAQAFFAPVFFLLIGFSLRILESSKTALSDSSGVGTILTFIIAAVFMLASLRAAKQMSEIGSKYLGDIYKGANAIAGWAPKAYVSGLRQLGGFVGTNTVGAVGDRLGRGYDKWVATAPKGSVREKFFAGSGMDRAIRGGLTTVAKTKFGGKEGYEESLHAKEERKKNLDEKKRFEEARKKQPELAAENQKARERAKALTDEFGDLGKRQKLEDDLARQKYNGKKFADLTEKQRSEVMKDARWRAQFNDLNALAREWSQKNLGTATDWTGLTNEQREKMVDAMKKEGKWKGRSWKKDKEKGTYGWETGWPYDDEVRRSIDLRTAEEKNVAAQNKFNKNYDALDSLQKTEIDKGRLTLQGTIDELRRPLNDVGWDTIKDEHLRNKKILHEVTPMLSHEQYIELLGDKNISKEEKDHVREGRLGSIMDKANELEEKVVELSDWEKYTDAQKAEATNRGKVVRGSADYDAFRWSLHEQMKKYYDPEEITDYVESDVGREHGLRANRLFNDAITNGVYQQLQKSKKISSGEKRYMRNLKRTRGENAATEDERATALFDEIQLQDARDESRRQFGKDYADLTEVQKEAVDKKTLISSKARDEMWETDEVAQEMFGENLVNLSEKQKQYLDSNPISEEAFYRIYRVKGGDGSKEARLFKAAWLRRRAEAAADRYYGGKTPEEIATEMKQESFGSRVAGKYMRRDQLRASQSKDQIWQDKQAEAMAIYGSPEEVYWLRHTSDGQNYRVDWDRINEKRKEAGLDSWEVSLQKGKKVTEANEVDGERSVEEIADENAAASGQAPIQKTNVNQAASEIRNIIQTQEAHQQNSQSIENLHPESTTEPIAERVDSMTPNQIVELAEASPDLFEAPAVAAALDVSHADALIQSVDVSPKTRRTLIENIVLYSKDKTVRKLLWERWYDRLTSDQRKILDRDAQENRWERTP